MKDQITYSESYTVKLNGKTIGEIRAVYDSQNDFPSNHLPGNLIGYRYFPKGGGDAGEIFNTPSACKRSLEN